MRLPLWKRLRSLPIVRSNDPTEGFSGPDWPIAGSLEIDIEHVVADLGSSVRALGVVMAKPGGADEGKLGATEADEEVQTLPFQSTD